MQTTHERKTKLSKKQLIRSIGRIMRHYERRRVEQLSLPERLRDIFSDHPSTSEILKLLHYLDPKSLRYHHDKLKRTIKAPLRGRPRKLDIELVLDVECLMVKQGLSLQKALHAVAKSRGDKNTKYDTLRRFYLRSAAKLNRKRGANN